MAELYNLRGTIVMDGDNPMIEYDKQLCGDVSETSMVQVHNNQNNVAKSIIGESTRFYILSCPNLQKGGEYEDFAILEDPETPKRIADAMKALKGKKPLFRSLNDHATEILKTADLSIFNKEVDLTNEVSSYVKKQVDLGNIKPHEKSWLESVCVHWYNKGKNN